MEHYMVIFAIGLLLGVIIRWVYDAHKETKAPYNEATFHIQEATILTLNETIKTLEADNKRLNERLKENEKAN